MFNGNSNYSLADIAAATGNNNNDGFCGNEIISVTSKIFNKIKGGY